MIINGTLNSIIKNNDSLIITLTPYEDVKYLAVLSECCCKLEINENKLISRQQQKTIHLLIKEISNFMGEMPINVKNLLKKRFYEKTLLKIDSFGKCSSKYASNFIEFLITIIFEFDIPLTLIDYHILFQNLGEINYIKKTIAYKKCAICGNNGEIHHWDYIGMGHNRATVDDSNKRKICLCRQHHTEAHNIGRQKFEEKYHIYGVKIKDSE